MTEHPRTPVTVIGLGSMGRALAEAYVRAGHPTTVWNRTTSKGGPLVALGARQTRTVEKAVTASPLVIACLTTFDATVEALGPAAAAVEGRTLVTLNSGSPADARAMAGWASGYGARYLGGAVKNVPSAVGAEDTLLYYGGDRGVFDEHAATLRVLGGDTVHLGADPDLAALYEMAVGGTLLPALVGFFQGAAALRARGLDAASMVRFGVKWFEMINALLPVFAGEIDRGDYSDGASSVDLFLAGAAHDKAFAEEAGLDVHWHRPFHDLLRRAVAAGHGGHSISALTEVLGSPVHPA
ncbi:NAD(P)-dependent oxidoreductase [Streptomyces griseobrunneus]